MAMQRMTPEQKAKIDYLVKKLAAAIEKETDHAMVIQALTFLLFGSVKAANPELSERETVEYIAERFKVYAQFVFS